ncbi:uncharacterized protein LOC131843186 [Achroia grisella]|uniref:uncharacterized protein LOC131843186 n=1 Tax=Achroia grisella TaxID=688607 RepID=UPI0027D30460|nr:uncharacterized protein LOC131843186 [Achroia grisella]
MELIKRQADIFESINKIRINFNKDSSSRKTSDYLKNRIETLNNLWGEFEQNHVELSSYEDKSAQYFRDNIYQKTKDVFQDIISKLISFNKEDKGTQRNQKADELLTLQRTNFRAFNRLLLSVNVDSIDEKWELEDELRSIQSRWSTIENLHLQIDNILQGEDVDYDTEFASYETSYRTIKRRLNKKLSSAAHLNNSTPQLEIPTFTGQYTHWPTFHDLFYEAIHNNNTLSKSQKMQHLKGKIKGEAERLIHHLTISSDNYDTAWEILTHRYNNPQILFTKHIEILLNQANISKQTSFDIKKLHDVSMECIHAIHNLGIDTTTWDPLLVHILSKKLDHLTYAAYMEARKDPRSLPALDEFMGFLESKFTALEPISRKERVVTTEKVSQHHISKPSSSNSFRFMSTGRPSINNYSHNNTGRNKIDKPYQKPFFQAVTTKTYKCPQCNQDHDLFKCNQFIDLSPKSKLATVTKLNICPNCLYKHDTNCFSTKRCKECNGEHNTMLHDAFPIKRSPQMNNKNFAKSADKRYSANYVANNDEMLLTTIQMQVLSSDGSYVTLRALLDQGSQVTMITESAVQLNSCTALSVLSNPNGLPREHLNASVAGIGESPNQSRGKVLLDCKSLRNDYEFVAEALIMPRKIVRNLPTTSFDISNFHHLKNLPLADPDYNTSSNIDILLNTNIYSEIILDGLIKVHRDEPIAQRTELGWIVSGRVGIKTFNCHVVINDLSEISQYWEIEDITSSLSPLSEGEQRCENIYMDTTKRLEDGKYEVALPMKSGFEQHIGKSKERAIAQFKQLEHKLTKNTSFFVGYKGFMDEYKDLGHMRKTNSTEQPLFYMPHHGVTKLDSTTTKLRVVFNASSKTSSGYSLNDLMECGPNLQHDIQGLIIKWRQYKYVITADIEKMFRQIMVRKSDQILQSIIWRSSEIEPLQTYHLTTVTYGTKAAPYLAMRTLRQLAQDDGDIYPLAASALEQSFYMDDLLGGADSLEQTKELQRQIISILSGAGMNIRKWSSNDARLVEDLSPEMLDSPYEFKCKKSRKTLGLQWSPSGDSFSYQNISYESNSKSYTKRHLLSSIAKLFDPLGWLSPVSIRAKLIFQRVWATGLSWDTQLPYDIIQDWNQLENDFKTINKFTIKRYLGQNNNNIQLHGFSDASEKAYACAVYIVSTDCKGKFTSTLVAAKTKLSPLNKKVSLPRLELCGTVLLSQLIHKVVKSLTYKNIQIYAWTDSMIVLGWLQGDKSRWKEFVANRVQQATDIIPPSQWHHVKTDENPADCATRGMTSSHLENYRLWWEGPRWLLTFNPNSMVKEKYQPPNIEIKKACVNVALYQNEQSFIMNLLNDYSSLTQITRILAWVLRFIERARCQQNTTRVDTLSFEEMKRSMNLIIKSYQAYQFLEDISNLNKKQLVSTKSSLGNLNPFMDTDGILRVGGRLNNSILSYTAKHPIILGSNSRLTELIIHQAHLATLHGGPKLTLSYIRNKYWIISGIRTVKRQLRKCVKCRRYNHHEQNQIMADLPQPRVTPSRPFTHTGVDYTGFVELKVNKGRGIRTSKGYISVFVCLSTKAIHLELVSDLSTPAFLAAFRRFCSRRGTPQHMYSDNGTNFVGADRCLKREYKEILSYINHEFINKVTEMEVQWHFNAPAWPSAGGLWERAVGSLKYHLKRVIGEQKLTYEEFTTLLCQIEACLNSRPLCVLSENADDEYLTPGHFLVGGALLSRPQSEPHIMQSTTRWQLVQSMNKHFWKRWSDEYLQQLQTRSKWRAVSRNLAINDVVLIKEESLPPGRWALGRIQELHPGKDGHVRVVTLKTHSNMVKRPISKLVLLPVTDEPSSLSKNQAERENITKSKCTRKPKSFLTYVYTALLMMFMLFTPTMQLEVQPYNITQLNNDQGLYFDKISDLQVIRDEWNLVVYYNMTPYWQGSQTVPTHQSAKQSKRRVKIHGSNYDDRMSGYFIVVGSRHRKEQVEPPLQAREHPPTRLGESRESVLSDQCLGVSEV